MIEISIACMLRCVYTLLLGQALHSVFDVLAYPQEGAQLWGSLFGCSALTVSVLVRQG